MTVSKSVQNFVSSSDPLNITVYSLQDLLGPICQYIINKFVIIISKSHKGYCLGKLVTSIHINLKKKQ